MQRVLDAITGAPAWILAARHDIVAMNHLARALYSPVIALPRRPASTTSFVCLYPGTGAQVLRRYDQIANDAAAIAATLRAGPIRHDRRADRTGRQTGHPTAKRSVSALGVAGHCAYHHHEAGEAVCATRGRSAGSGPCRHRIPLAQRITADR